MVFRDLLRETLRTLAAHKLRTALTMFGIAWGIVSIILMVAAGEGLRDGQIKLIGVSSPERLKEAPQVPTLREQGVDFVRFGWLGFCARKGTPQPILDKLHRALTAVVAMPEYRSLMEKGGSIPVSSSPAELRQVIDETVTEVEATVKEFGLQQD